MADSSILHGHRLERACPQSSGGSRGHRRAGGAGQLQILPPPPLGVLPRPQPGLMATQPQALLRIGALPTALLSRSLAWEPDGALDCSHTSTRAPLLWERPGQQEAQKGSFFWVPAGPGPSPRGWHLHGQTLSGAGAGGLWPSEDFRAQHCRWDDPHQRPRTPLQELPACRAERLAPPNPDPPSRASLCHLSACPPAPRKAKGCWRPGPPMAPPAPSSWAHDSAGREAAGLNKASKSRQTLDVNQSSF